MTGVTEAEWTLVTGPIIEPMTVTEAKNQARVTESDEDGLFANWIRAARSEAESYLGRGLLTQTWKIIFDQFYDYMWLPMAAPLQNDPLASPSSTAPVVQYYDTDGVLQTLSTTFYLVNTTSRPGRIERAPAQAWPAVQADRSGTVIITYVVGWTDPAFIPDSIMQGMRCYVTAMECDREGASDALTAARRCWTDRVFWIPPSCP